MTEYNFDEVQATSEEEEKIWIINAGKFEQSATCESAPSPKEHSENIFRTNFEVSAF